MTPQVDLSVYLVLDTGQCGGMDPCAVAVAAAEAGIRMIQLRMKAASHDDRVALGREMARALRPFGGCFVINDDVEAALAAGADGAHVGQSDMAPTEARALLGPNRVLGLSIETVAQARRVDAAVVDHVGIGPVKATATKGDAAAPLGWAGLAEAVALSPVPAVAIGGVKDTDAPAVLATGAVGMAVVTAICGQPDPKRAAAALLRAMEDARRVGRLPTLPST